MAVQLQELMMQTFALLRRQQEAMRDSLQQLESMFEQLRPMLDAAGPAARAAAAAAPAAAEAAAAQAAHATNAALDAAGPAAAETAAAPAAHASNAVLDPAGLAARAATATPAAAEAAVALMAQAAGNAAGAAHDAAAVAASVPAQGRSAQATQPAAPAATRDTAAAGGEHAEDTGSSSSVHFSWSNEQAVQAASFPKLSLDPTTSYDDGLPLAVWLSTMESCMQQTRVPDDDWPRTAIYGSMHGELQATCLALLEAGELPCWGSLKEMLLWSYGQHDQQCGGSANSTLQSEGAQSGCPTRQDGRAVSLKSGNPARHEAARTLISGMRKTARPFKRSVPEPGPRRQCRNPPLPGGRRGTQDSNADGAQFWKPKLRRAERLALIAQGCCLCCQEVPDDGHRWADCPENPDRRQ